MKNSNGATTLSQKEILDLFKSEDRAIRWMEKIRWGKTGIFCAKCGSTEKVKLRASAKEKRYWCGACRSTFNVKTKTPMEDTKISVAQWIEASYILMTSRMGVSAMQLSKQMGITRNTAWYLLQRIRLACGESLSVTSFRKLKGTIEIDESFCGPVVSRMSKEQKDKWKARWGDARGSKGKGMVIGLRERETGYRVYVAFSPYTVPKQPTVEKIIAKYVEPGATIYTDDASYYQGLRNLGYKGASINKSSPAEWVKAMGGNTNSIESDWAVVKRAWKGTYVWWSMKYFQLYMNEFAFRLDSGNVKRDTIDRLESLFGAMVGKTLMMKELRNETKSIRKELRDIDESNSRDLGFELDDEIPY